MSIEESITLSPLLDLTMLLLFNLRHLNQSHAFAISLVELLLDQRKSKTMSPQAGKQLFHFLRLIIKDKKAQLSELVGGDYSSDEDNLDDQLLDID